MRITLRALLGKATIPLQVDVGFGDVITPAARHAEWPALLDFPNPLLWTYPPETAIAEKCEAMVYLGLDNTRLKDFFDLWHLATHLDFGGPILCQAIAATCQRRDTAISAVPPPALTAAFYEDSDRQRQWSTFWKRSSLPAEEALSLAECCELLHVFLVPLLESVRAQTSLDLTWRHDGRAWQRLTGSPEPV